MKTRQRSWRAEAQQQIALRRLKAKRGERGQSFRQFVSAVNPRYQWYKHCEVIADVAERVASGKLKRVMLFVPPRHSKSETISRLFTAHYLRRHPDKWVGLCSYSSELAYVLSHASQDNYIASGGSLSAKAGAVKHWETGKGGGLWAAGVGGPITGKGFHVGIIDDPIKNSEEASSAVIREKQKEWYRSTFYTRAEPDAAIVVIQTRWHEDDLSGWLLSDEDGDSPERWHVVNLPAIAESPQGFPTSCTVEPDWRKEGEALCDARYPLSRLNQVAARIGGYYFSALYQQRPSNKEGAFFKVSQLQIVDAVPANLKTIRAWDLAASTNGDYTVGAKLGKDDAGIFYILDIVRGQWTPDERNRVMMQASALDGRSTRIRLSQDPGAAGVDQVQALTRMLAGYNVRSERESGSKEVRADGFASQVNAGNVRMLAGDWNKAFIEEARTFPLGKHDDQCLARGTLIQTARGEKPIEDIYPGEYVATRAGFRRVTWAGMTNKTARVNTLHFSNGSSLVGTANHPVFVENKGFVPLDTVSNGDTICAWQNTNLLDTRAFSFGAIQSRKVEHIAFTLFRVLLTSSAALIRFIGKSTKTITGQSLTDFTSTIRMTTRSITIPETWWPLHPGITTLNTTTRPSPMLNPKSNGSIWSAFGQVQPLGIVASRDESGTGNMARKFLASARQESSLAGSVANRSRLGVMTVLGTITSDFAPMLAPLGRYAVRVDILRKRLVQRAAKYFKALQKWSAAPVYVERVCDGHELAEVYNLTVEGEHEYFANGVLVHNCDAISNAFNDLSATQEFVVTEWIR